jgi:hypothetical protein
VRGPPIQVILHGVPEVNFDRSRSHKARLGLAGQRMLCTFGLISRGKGLESMIEAMPRIVAAYPKTVYLIVGVTHPEVNRQEGEVYRESLARMAEALGVGAHVRFVNKYLGLCFGPMWAGSIWNSSAESLLPANPDICSIKSGRIMMAANQQREQPKPAQQQKLDTLTEFIQQQVLKALGKPRNLLKVQVNPIWDNHYRVNVFVGVEGGSATVANSYFLVIDTEGNVIAATPKIVKQY